MKSNNNSELAILMCYSRFLSRTEPKQRLTMLYRIKSFFDEHLAPGAQTSGGALEHMLHLATSALLLEMVQVDGESRPEQSEAAKIAVIEHLDLDEGEVTELLDLAAMELANSTDYFQFTSLINSTYSLEQKVDLIERLWRIAYANQSLHIHEEFLVRKIADLLYVPHSAFITVKHRVIDAALDTKS